MALRHRKHYRMGRHCIEFLAGAVVALASLLLAVLLWTAKQSRRLLPVGRSRPLAPPARQSEQVATASIPDSQRDLAAKALVRLGFSKKEAERRIEVSADGCSEGMETPELVAAALRG